MLNVIVKVKLTKIIAMLCMYVYFAINLLIDLYQYCGQRIYEALRDFVQLFGYKLLVFLVINKVAFNIKFCCLNEYVLSSKVLF